MSECTNPEYYSAQNCNYSINNKFTLKRHSTNECCCTDNKQNIKNIALKLRGERIEDLFIPEGFEVPEELNASISVNGQIFANIYTYKVK